MASRQKTTPDPTGCTHEAADCSPPARFPLLYQIGYGNRHHITLGASTDPEALSISGLQVAWAFTDSVACSVSRIL